MLSPHVNRAILSVTGHGQATKITKTTKSTKEESTKIYLFFFVSFFLVFVRSAFAEATGTAIALATAVVVSMKAREPFFGSA
jgi:hypothetical protein